MTQFRKKPVVIEAMQLTGGTAQWHDVYQWIERNTQGSFESLDVIEGRKPYPASGVSIEPCYQTCIATGKRPIFQLIINGCVCFLFSDTVKRVHFPEN